MIIGEVPMPGGPLGVDAIAMTMRFGEFVALDNVELKVRPGSFHALLGENGAGKSTLVKCIMGYYRQTEGEVLIAGRQQAIANPKDAHALGLGMGTSPMITTALRSGLPTLRLRRTRRPAS